ncbi:hypothetical protein F750_0396 [Streptomyces sp. PAMC 26508]|nr:hypothetical protein F750_0396 [Streptomyces sp. PAMC 26508]
MRADAARDAEAALRRTGLGGPGSVVAWRQSSWTPSRSRSRARPVDPA